MRLSRYIQKREVAPGIIGMYNPFGHEVSFLPVQQHKAIEEHRFYDVAPQILSDLSARKFIVEEGFENTILDQYRPGEEGIREMWLILAQSCNMSCQYCVVEGNVEDPERRVYGGRRELRMIADHPEKASTDMMSPEIAEAAVHKFSRFLHESRPLTPRVTLYGGEPLLNIQTIMHVVPLIRDISYPGQPRPNPVQVLVITNGQIYEEELTTFFRKHSVSVSISLDGMKHHHDAVRVNHAGRGTFDQAVKSLKRYQAAGLRTGICTTIGTHNVNHLPEIADYFAKEFNVPVEFEVPFDIPMNGGNKFYLPMKDAAAKALEAYTRLREKGLIEGLAIRRMIQVARGEFHHRDCSAVGGQWVVAPDGMIGPCHSLVGERTYFSGDVRKDDCDPFTQETFREWWKRMPINMPDCHGCSAIAICGGGCPYNALIKRGSIWEKDPQQCEYMHELIDWLIGDMWERYITVQSKRGNYQDHFTEHELVGLSSRNFSF